MNKLLIASLAGALSLGLLANPVPAPVTAVPAPAAALPAAVPSTVAPVPAPVAAVQSAVANAPAVEEAELGALCKVYCVKSLRSRPNRRVFQEEREIRRVLEELEQGATAVDWGYDAKSSRFDAAAIAKHWFSVASWEGVLDTKRAGTIVVNATSGSGYCVTINGQSISGCGQLTMSVPLKKGFNRISIVRNMLGDRRDFSIDFRDAASTKPARPLLPSMLKHLVGDEDAGPDNDIL